MTSFLNKFKNILSLKKIDFEKYIFLIVIQQLLTQTSSFLTLNYDLIFNKVLEF